VSAIAISQGDTVTASVVIGRPLNEVFWFYRNFGNLPRFLGDVMEVEQVDPATWRWTIQGPLGVRTHWTIRVTEERANECIRFETVTSPMLKTTWRIYFTPAPAAHETTVREVMKIPLGSLGRAALAVIGKFPDKESPANLNRLKELLETGKVTDTSYAVPHKF
jgi:uncharacterized membrane protein